MSKLVRPKVLGEVLSGIEQRPGLEHHYFEPAFRQDFRGSPACGPRSDNADVIHFLRANDLKHRWSLFGSPSIIGC